MHDALFGGSWWHVHTLAWLKTQRVDWYLMNQTSLSPGSLSFFQVLERDGLRIQPPTTEIYLKEKPPPRNFIEKHCGKGLKWVKSSIMHCWYFLIDMILTRITYILQLLKRIDIFYGSNLDWKSRKSIQTTGLWKKLVVKLAHLDDQQLTSSKCNTLLANIWCHCYVYGKPPK